MNASKRKRTKSSQLPDENELNLIIAKESRREIPVSKKTNHYPSFTAVVQLLDFLNIQSNIFNDIDVGHEEVVINGNRIIHDVVQRLLNRHPIDELHRLLDAAYDYLSEEDNPVEADLIFVFGSKTPFRIKKAIELYEAGYSEKIMISGGAPFYEDNSKSEAEEYRRIAIENNVNAENIIVETSSISIPDNVRTSLNQLDSSNQSINSIILVNSPYVQRRGWVHFMKYIEKNQTLIRVNSATSPKFSKSQWFMSEDGIRVVLNEYVKMKIATSINTA